MKSVSSNIWIWFLEISDFDAELYADHFYLAFVTRRIDFKEENKEKVLNISQTYENTDLKVFLENLCYGNSLLSNVI